MFELIGIIVVVVFIFRFITRIYDKYFNPLDKLIDKYDNDDNNYID